ncbi:fimbrillin family protein [Segatella copri]|uniref:fimbrillin family protein n=1 Tax=Segatella copri TaxID=165179 RepID=UPI00294B042F|nr:fimbrillin family protein [Segatella copri]
MNLINYHKMKFLRLAFYVLIAQLVLSGCAGEAVEETSSSSSSEINFDAYVGRNASTRSSITDMKFLQSGEWNAGFGVFARYNHTDGKTITSLMDTEHVTWRVDHWGYDHIRFWPSSGTVDFYAFAPYSPQVRMGSLPPELAGKADINSPNTYIDFPSNLSPVDLVWANQPNQTAPKSPNSKVKFQFKHALVRLGFDITANQVLEEKGAVITVDKVILYGANETSGIFLMAGYLNLKTGDWVPYNNNFSWFYTWTPTGKVDGKNDEQLKIDGPIYKLSATQLDNNTPSIANEKDSYIFIIPQDPPKNFNLMITYRVQQGDLEETVTVRKNLLDVLPKDRNPFGVRGKAYTFHFKLSLDPVDFSVTVDGKKRDEVTGEITI